MVLPSKYQPRDFVSVELFEAGKINGCRVEAVTFEEGKVYYDVSVKCGKDCFTTLSHVDAAFVSDNTPDFDSREAEIERLRAENAKLQAFKDFVHRRLDEAGVPTHPDGEHSKHGCRIGDRLDIALAFWSADKNIPDFKKLRIQAGLTLRDVERATGLSNPYLSQLENGAIKKPSHATVETLTNFYYQLLIS